MGQFRAADAKWSSACDDFMVWWAYLDQMMAFCSQEGIFKWKLDGYPDLCQIWEESHHPSHTSALFGPGDFEI